MEPSKSQIGEVEEGVRTPSRLHMLWLNAPDQVQRQLGAEMQFMRLI